MKTDVIVVGAGLAGLSCAHRLCEYGLTARLFEAADAPGGRVRTDRVEGFRLDRGFQVLLTAYPAAQRRLDYDALDLKPFYSGALIHRGGRFQRFADPRRHPADALSTLTASIGSFADKLRVARLGLALRGMSLETLWDRPETTTEAALRHRWGFSEAMIDGFFRPFIGGVTFDRSLETSSRFFSFVMKMFAEGETAVPALGMQAIPDQLAAGLPAGTLTLNAPVARLTDDGQGVVVGEETHRARAVVLATDAPAMAAFAEEGAVPASRSTACVYFAAEKPPHEAAALLLDGEGRGPVNNVAVMSNVAPDYAPPGAALIAASVVGWPEADDATLEATVRDHLARWFGMEVGSWRRLRTYRIRHALPAMVPGQFQPTRRDMRVRDRVHVCGDHRVHASIQGAFVSGRRAAASVAVELGIA